MNKFFQFNEFVELGKVFKDCEAYLIALENFNRAIALSYLPINKERLVEAYDLRGHTKILLKRYTEVIEDATKAIDLNPDEPTHFKLRGCAYHHLNIQKKAIEDVNKAIDLNPNEPQHFRLRGDASFHLKDYKKAVEDAI